MTAVRIYYDDNALWVDNVATAFVAGTLAAVMASDGVTLQIMPRNGSYAFASPKWSDVADIDGTTFPTPDAVMAYLAGEFAKRRPVGLAPLTFTAGEPIGGQKAVRVSGDDKVYLASSDAPNQIGDTLGIAMNAAAIDAPVTVMIEGEMDDPSWSFVPGPIFLGLAGSLTQATPELPAAAFRQRLATVLSPTRLLIERSYPVLLA